VGEPLAFVVSGASGRMGQAVAVLAAENPAVEIVGGIGRAETQQAQGYPRVVSPASADGMLRRAGAIIDFSAPPLLRDLLERQRAALAGLAIVIGTTGLEPADHALVREVATHSPVLLAANFSVGVNLLVALVEQAARALPLADFDAEIVEMHHRLKADAPSGTALELLAAIGRGRGAPSAPQRADGRSGHTGARSRGEVGLHALRGGDVAGEHRVVFFGSRERLELSHAVSDRAVFAEGALRAAQWLAGRAPGSYTMQDVLGATQS
jgi:4-hydroxy-tetrahydrodipicolinate reductase